MHCIWKIIKIKENSKRVFRDYTEDEYEGINYRWEWEEHYNGIEMINLHSICECGCTFNYSSFDSYLNVLIGKNNIEIMLIWIQQKECLQIIIVKDVKSLSEENN